MESNTTNSGEEKKLTFEFYEKQREMWPKAGKHILAHFDDNSIVVYQAFNPAIATYAVKYQKFSGNEAYNETRMTWIKTNFLWMMYRCGWAQKKSQDRVLAIWMKRAAFDRILRRAAGFKVKSKETEDRKHAKPWRVQLQWDPDHYPNGEPHIGRKAVQLGIKGIESFANGEDILKIEDITDFVISQFPFVKSVPKESVYPLPNDLMELLMEQGNTQKKK